MEPARRFVEVEFADRGRLSGGNLGTLPGGIDFCVWRAVKMADLDLEADSYDYEKGQMIE
jgi:hypothetical protein